MSYRDQQDRLRALETRDRFLDQEASRPVPISDRRAELYRAALAADQRFAAELKKAYGRDACNRRYDADTSKHPPAVREAYAEFQATNEAWLEAMRATFNTPEEEVGDVICFEVSEPA